MGCRWVVAVVFGLVLALASAVPLPDYDYLPANFPQLNDREQDYLLEKNGINEAQLDALERFERARQQREQTIARMREDQIEAGLKRVQEDVVQIPGEQPKTNETYLCTAYRQEENRYIVGFEPMADQHEIHHIIVFGCDAPGVNRFVPAWNCGEMSTTDSTQYLKAPPCAGSPRVIYAWAKGAPKLELPRGVAFPVGGETENQFLVVQVHYMHAMKKPDFSGVKLRYTDVPQPRTAATLLIVTGGAMAPKKTENFEAACAIDEPVELHPFAFRVHTHRHGRKVSGYVVKEDPLSQEDVWYPIGERDPQKEQLFEAVKNTSMIIQQNDILAARCVMQNDEDRIIQMGPTGEDEMCNFYLMYWVEGSNVLNDNTCFSPGAPNYRWSREAGLNHVPK